MKKTTVTLFAAETELTASHVPVFVHGLPVPIYVRAEISDRDLSDALDHATPLDGETLLNTIEIGDEEPVELTTT